MYCSNCGAKLSKSAKFCPECGAKNISIEQGTPTKDTVAPAAAPTPAPSSEFQYKPPILHTATPLKFFLLTIVTFGVYVGYWGWRNWEIVKRARDLNVSPTWRGIFIVFTAASLFARGFHAS